MQTVHDGRQFLKYVDPKLGVPLPERDYGGNCLIYDADNKTDPFHNIWVGVFSSTTRLSTLLLFLRLLQCSVVLLCTCRPGP